MWCPKTLNTGEQCLLVHSCPFRFKSLPDFPADARAACTASILQTTEHGIGRRARVVESRYPPPFASSALREWLHLRQLQASTKRLAMQTPLALRPCLLAPHPMVSLILIHVLGSTQVYVLRYQKPRAGSAWLGAPTPGSIPSSHGGPPESHPCSVPRARARWRGSRRRRSRPQGFAGPPWAWRIREAAARASPVIGARATRTTTPFATRSRATSFGRADRAVGGFRSSMRAAAVMASAACQASPP